MYQSYRLIGCAKPHNSISLGYCTPFQNGLGYWTKINHLRTHLVINVMESRPGSGSAAVTARSERNDDLELIKSLSVSAEEIWLLDDCHSIIATWVPEIARLLHVCTVWRPPQILKFLKSPHLPNLVNMTLCRNARAIHGCSRSFFQTPKCVVWLTICPTWHSVSSWIPFLAKEPKASKSTNCHRRSSGCHWFSCPLGAKTPPAFFQNQQIIGTSFDGLMRWRKKVRGDFLRFVVWENFLIFAKNCPLWTATTLAPEAVSKKEPWTSCKCAPIRTYQSTENQEFQPIHHTFHIDRETWDSARAVFAFDFQLVSSKSCFARETADFVHHACRQLSSLELQTFWHFLKVIDLLENSTKTCAAVSQLAIGSPAWRMLRRNFIFSQFFIWNNSGQKTFTAQFRAAFSRMGLKRLPKVTFYILSQTPD